MLTPDFAFCHIVTIEHWKGREINREVYDDPVTVKARVNLGRKKTWRQSGMSVDEVIASGTVYLPAGTKVSPQDKITFGGMRYSVIESRPRYWFDGTENHVEVTIQ